MTRTLIIQLKCESAVLTLAFPRNSMREEKLLLCIVEIEHTEWSYYQYPICTWSIAKVSEAWWHFRIWSIALHFLQETIIVIIELQIKNTILWKKSMPRMNGVFCKSPSTELICYVVTVCHSSCSLFILRMQIKEWMTYVCKSIFLLKFTIDIKVVKMSSIHQQRLPSWLLQLLICPQIASVPRLCYSYQRRAVILMQYYNYLVIAVK